MMSLTRFYIFCLFLLTFSGLPKPDVSIVKTEFSITAGHRTKEEDNESIPWSYKRKLIWDDYLCEPERHTDAVASTSTTLGLTYQLQDGVLNYQVVCDFSKMKSWVIMKTPYILAHEQGHFDITEIFARKLNKALQEYRYNRRTYKRDLNVIYENIIQEKEDFQERYDHQTDHSRNRKAQYQWLEKIDELLQNTEGYANYP